MKSSKTFLLVCLLSVLVFQFQSIAQVYPPSKQLVYDSMPPVPKPDYLSPITDSTFSSTVIRIADEAYFESISTTMRIHHHYAKDQPWNSDGSLICLDGWPAAILDGEDFSYIKNIVPPWGPHTWSNTQPNIIYGTDQSNTLVKVDVNTNTKTTIETFDQFEFVSFGNYEGNLSNDDRYIALQCSTATSYTIVCYDLLNEAIVSEKPAPIWPNNCNMSQSGDYVLVQWDVGGYNDFEGIWAYNRDDMSPVRNLTSSGGGHYDFGYDMDGNEVCVGADVDNGSPGIYMVRLDNGERTYLLSEAQMTWQKHVSCRNLDRPGWAYLTEYFEEGTPLNKANYQKIFAVKLDPNANNNAETQTFAFIHHSNIPDDWSPKGVPNRDGSIVMWMSDWMEGLDSPIESYVAFMPQTVGVKEHTDHDRLYFYPNPATHSITLDIDNSDNMEGVIVSMLGQVVYRFENPIIDISLLPNGPYFMVVKNGNNQYIGRLIKN